MIMDTKIHYLRAKIQLSPYLLHTAFSFGVAHYGGEVSMDSHEMGSHVLMMKSPFFRAPNSVSQRGFAGQTIIIQVRAWQNMQLILFWTHTKAISSTDPPRATQAQEEKPPATFCVSQRLQIPTLCSQDLWNCHKTGMSIQ